MIATTRNCRFEETEEIIEQMDMSGIADDIAITEDNIQIVISGYYVYLESVGIKLRKGIICYFDDEEHMFMPDEVVTVIYREDSDRNRDICYEAENMEGAFYDYLGGRMTAGEIANLPCEIIAENVNK